jgi:nucleoside-diphosphate-sugar epimerase
MRIVLTGATGFVGSEVLQKLATTPGVDEITCLARRAPAALPPKTTLILHDDFSRYDAGLINRLADHSACIWALGGKEADLGKPDVLERVTYTFTLAFARTLALRARRPFTFCYLSGMGADPTETARFPWERLTRHLKGRTERELAALQRDHQAFCSHSFRPGGILPTTAHAALDYLLAPIVVRVRALAQAMITAAVEPAFFGQAPLLHNSDIKRVASGTFNTHQTRGMG